MISSQQVIECIQKNVGVPWQSQRSDGFFDGILIGSGDIAVAGVRDHIHANPRCLREAVDSGKSVVICREWEAAEYMRDAIASGQKKALIQLPHEGGEEAGMEECAHWLRTFVTEVPIGFIPSGDPFWMPA